MPEYFGRQYRIDINNGETVFDSREMLHPLQVEFLVDTSFGAALSQMELSIYNLSKASMGRIKQGQKITVQAGYENSFGVIFVGTISNTQTPQEGTERRTTMWCWSGIKESQEKVCKLSFDAGTGYFHIIESIAKDLMGKDPEIVGFEDQSKLAIATDGYGECAPHKSLLNQLAYDNEFRWLIENEKVLILEDGAHRKAEPKLIDVNNGLVGGVSLTWLGADIEIKLDSNFSVGDRVLIKSKSTTINFSSIYSLQLPEKVTKLGEGVYTIRALKRKGSFYDSNSWSSELTCWREGEKGERA